ncbi:unnamed protein product, partial [Amoebophrya sp. A25]
SDESTLADGSALEAGEASTPSSARERTFPTSRNLVTSEQCAICLKTFLVILEEICGEEDDVAPGRSSGGGANSRTSSSKRSLPRGPIYQLSDGCRTGVRVILGNEDPSHRTRGERRSGEGDVEQGGTSASPSASSCSTASPTSACSPASTTESGSSLFATSGGTSSLSPSDQTVETTDVESPSSSSSACPTRSSSKRAEDHTDGVLDTTCTTSRPDCYLSERDIVRVHCTTDFPADRPGHVFCRPCILNWIDQSRWRGDVRTQSWIFDAQIRRVEERVARVRYAERQRARFLLMQNLDHGPPHARCPICMQVMEAESIREAANGPVRIFPVPEQPRHRSRSRDPDAVRGKTNATPHGASGSSTTTSSTRMSNANARSRTSSPRGSTRVSSGPTFATAGLPTRGSGQLVSLLRRGRNPARIRICRRIGHLCRDVGVGICVAFHVALLGYAIILMFQRVQLAPLPSAPYINPGVLDNRCCANPEGINCVSELLEGYSTTTSKAPYPSPTSSLQPG